MNFLPTIFISNILATQDNNIFQSSQNKDKGINFLDLLSKNFDKTKQKNTLSQNGSVANESVLPLLLLLLITNNNLNQQINTNSKNIDNGIESSSNIITTLQNILKELQNKLVNKDLTQVNNLDSIVQNLKEHQKLIDNNELSKEVEKFLQIIQIQKDNDSFQKLDISNIADILKLQNKDKDNFSQKDLNELLQSDEKDKINIFIKDLKNTNNSIEKILALLSTKDQNINLPLQKELLHQIKNQLQQPMANSNELLKNNEKNKINTFIENLKNINNSIEKILALLSTKDQNINSPLQKELIAQIKNQLQELIANFKDNKSDLKHIELDTSTTTQNQKNNINKLFSHIVNISGPQEKDINNSIIINKNIQVDLAKGEADHILTLLHQNSNSKNHFSNHSNYNNSEPNIIFLNLQQTLNSEEINPSNVKFRDELFRQIEQGIFKNLGDGKKELTIKLFPPELGAIKLSIEVQNKEVSLTIHTDNNQVTKALNQHISNFEKSLDQQGLKVVKIEIREDLSNENQGSWTQHRGFQEQKNKTNSRFRTKSQVAKVKLIGETDIEALPPNVFNRFGKSAIYIIA